MRADIILIRHAESLVPVPVGPDDYHRPLTEAGFTQAERLADELTAVQPSTIVSSPYLRAIQTVEPTARAVGKPVHIHRDLREWDSGLEPTPDYARHYAESWSDPHFSRPGAESLDRLTDRATAILRLLAERHPEGTVVVGSHGTFIARALLGFGVAEVDWPFSHAMPSPAIYRLRFAGSRVDAQGSGPLSASLAPGVRSGRPGPVLSSSSASCAPSSGEQPRPRRRPSCRWDRRR